MVGEEQIMRIVFAFLIVFSMALGDCCPSADENKDTTQSHHTGDGKDMPCHENEKENSCESQAVTDTVASIALK